MKRGDTVRVAAKDSAFAGCIGIITEERPGFCPLGVKLPKHAYPIWFAPIELELTDA